MTYVGAASLELVESDDVATHGVIGSWEWSWRHQQGCYKTAGTRKRDMRRDAERFQSAFKDCCFCAMWYAKKSAVRSMQCLLGVLKAHMTLIHIFREYRQYAMVVQGIICKASFVTKCSTTAGAQSLTTDGAYINDFSLWLYLVQLITVITSLLRDGA